MLFVCFFFRFFVILSLLGEGCLDKPLATLWKNYCQSSRPDVSMRLSVCSSGLQVIVCQVPASFFFFFSFSYTWTLTVWSSCVFRSFFFLLEKKKVYCSTQCQVRLSLWTHTQKLSGWLILELSHLVTGRWLGSALKKRIKWPFSYVIFFCCCCCF